VTFFCYAVVLKDKCARVSQQHSAKGLIVAILGFVGCMVCAVVFQLCHCSVGEAVDDTQMGEDVCIPRKKRIHKSRWWARFSLCVTTC
jgi:hypothetical protein